MNSPYLLPLEKPYCYDKAQCVCGGGGESIALIVDGLYKNPY